MHFEKQAYQEDCVNNIIQVLQACDVRNNDFSHLPNAIDQLWRERGYTQFIKRDVKRLDILMETGTGKTFTYLKTIFEMHKNFAKTKFIIVLPRTAIKLGVVQNIKLTRDFFFQEYGQHLKYIDYPKERLSKIQHDFLNTDDLVVLLTTNSAFNSDKNKINQSTETLFEQGSVWNGIKNIKPIIIIDEPHLLSGAETQKGLDKLDNSLQIRFGATFPKDKKDQAHHLSNVVYSLDSISSFRQYLVKGITVHTLMGDWEQGGLKVSALESKAKTFMAVYDINQVVYKKKIRVGEDIGTITGLENYKGVSATQIKKDKVYLTNQSILEVSKEAYELGDQEMLFMIKEAIAKHFAKEQKLFDKGIKALSLFFIPRIDDFRENEQNPNPRIKTIFAAEYKIQRDHILKTTQNEAYKNYLAKDFSESGKLQVHEGYFSGDKISTKDKDAGLNKEDLGVNLILNEKQKLLSLETSLRFIFSVWALQEGWDNPNVFTICKLADTAKDTSRRQQVGRGLRIAVNQNGVRQTYQKLYEKEHDFYDINTLDMIVSGKEREFIHAIQQEIQQASFSLVGDVVSPDTLKDLELSDGESNSILNTLKRKKIINDEGVILSSIYEFLKVNKQAVDETSDFNGDMKIIDERYQEILKIFTDNRNLVKDGNQEKYKKKVKIRPNQWQQFKTLWQAISKKSKIVYKNINEQKLVEKVAEEFNRQDIEPIQIKRLIQKYNAQSDQIENTEETQMGQIDFFQTQKFSDFLDFFVKKEKLPFGFMLKLLNKMDKQKIQNNPKKAQARLLEIFKDTIHGNIFSSVSYQFMETSIYPNDLQNEDGHKKPSIPYTLLGKSFTEKDIPENLLYDTICYDSDIEAEIQQEDFQKVNGKTITVFAKLPQIPIPTPYKNYNPDFAYLIDEDNRKKLFLIVETKGYKNQDDIPKEEKQKIDYAKKFFESLKNQLKDENIEVRYKTRINGQSLSDLLQNTG